MYSLVLMCMFFFFKQKTAYEMRISDWSSDVCSSDLAAARYIRLPFTIGIFSRVCRYLWPRSMLYSGANSLWRLRLLRSERSEERRGGKGCVRTCSSRGSPEP